MIPQNNYTLKHNSLTKSSSWRGAHWLLACGKYEWPPYYSSKPKTNEVWRFENSHCGGRAALTTPSDKVCLSSPFPGNSLRKWNPVTQTWISPTREHHKQHRHPHPRCVSPSPHLRKFRHDLQQQAIPELHPDSRTLFAHIYKKFSSGAHEGWEKWQKEFWQNLQLTQYLFGWSDLIMQDHTFLRHSME